MIEFQRSRLKQLGLLIGAGLLVGASFFSAVRADDAFHRVVGWFGVLFFGVVLLILIKGFAEMGTVVRLDEIGIHDSRLGVAVVPWGEISEWHVASVQGTQFLCLELRNPDLFLPPGSALLRRLRSASTRLGYGHLAISFVGLSPSIDDAVDFIRKRGLPQRGADVERETQPGS